ncbi:MAG: ABC transporter permease [Leptospirillum sp.]|jgi:oligopeptide transport system permease protein
MRILKGKIRPVWIISLVIPVLAVPILLHFTQTIFNPQTQNAKEVLCPPGTPGHLLGCDFLGRDNLARLLSGSMVSLGIGLMVGFLSTLIGTMWGVLSGASGGVVDQMMMRILEVWFALPEILIATILLLVLGHGAMAVVVALTFGGWMGVARVIRGETLRIREQLYMEASRSVGTRPVWMILKHFIPNLLPVMGVLLLFRIPGGILGESTLSFLGLGISPPHSSWGTLVNEGFKALPMTPWVLLWPALAIVATLLSFQWIAEKIGNSPS